MSTRDRHIKSEEAATSTSTPSGNLALPVELTTKVEVRAAPAQCGEVQLKNRKCRVAISQMFEICMVEILFRMQRISSIEWRLLWAIINGMTIWPRKSKKKRRQNSILREQWSDRWMSCTNRIKSLRANSFSPHQLMSLFLDGHPKYKC